MNYFLKDVARYLVQQSKGDMRDYLVVFPNRRARLFFNKFLASFHSTPVWAPAYFTINDFLQELSESRIADPLTLIFMLFAEYRNLSGSEESFDEFYYHCETILSDFDDIDKYLVDARHLYTNLSELKALEDYSEYLTDDQVEVIRQFWEAFSSSKASEQKERFANLWELQGALYEKFNKRLDEAGLAYEGKAYRQAIDQLNAGQSIPFSDKQIAFVGFNALNRAEVFLFRKYQQLGNASFFWDYDQRSVEDRVYESGFFIREYLKQFPPPAGFHSSRVSQNPVKIITVEAPSDVAQAKLLPQCLEMIGVSEISSPEQSAIILADENLLLPVVNSIPDRLGQANISLGYPVVQTPVYQFLCLLTDLHANRKPVTQEGNRVSYYHKDYLAIMDHYYLQDVAEDEAYLAFRNRLLRENVVYVNPSEYNTRSAFYQLLFLKSPDVTSFTDYLIAVINSVASDLVSVASGNPTVKWQLESFRAIHKVLLRIRELVIDSGIEMRFKTLLNLIRKILSGYSVPFAGEPLSGLQIMGILETRTLDFENLIILSMNEGKFPKSGNVPSMIPFSLREGYGLPTVRHQDAIFAYYFYRLLHRSEKAVLIYNTRTEGMQKGEPSRFISQLRYESKPPPMQRQAGYTINTLPDTGIVARKDAYSQKVLEGYTGDAPQRKLSPSALNTYLGCKLRFFFRYIEGLDEGEQIEEDIEANVFGSILHKSIENLYAPYKNGLLTRDILDRMLGEASLIEESIDKAFATEYFHTESPAPYRGKQMIIREVIKNYIRGIVDYDRKHAPIMIRDLEYFVSYSYDLAPGRTLHLGGFIDRLDELNGMLRIIDYKTGKVGANFSGVEELFRGKSSKRNGAVFQTFMYAWMLSKSMGSQDICPSLFFVRDIYNEDFSISVRQSHNRNSTPITSYAPFATEFESGMYELLNELFHPETDFTQTEDVDYCENCPYNRICMRKPN